MIFYEDIYLENLIVNLVHFHFREMSRWSRGGNIFLLERDRNAEFEFYATRYIETL